VVDAIDARLAQALQLSEHGGHVARGAQLILLQGGFHQHSQLLCVFERLGSTLTAAGGHRVRWSRMSRKEQKKTETALSHRGNKQTSNSCKLSLTRR
jgi:hypothetical protein